MPDTIVEVIGAGFAGVEAAWACAELGMAVRLYEMRPQVTSPAHTTDWFAELVCSNSLKSKLPTSPAGLLKAEMSALGSVVLQVASQHEVPGGEALAVNRNEFGRAITKLISNHSLIEIVREEWIPDRHWNPELPTIIATGPLSSNPVSEWLAKLTGRKHLHFYDAVSPTVEASSINLDVAFAQSRYDKGGDDYLNCPMEKDEYFRFVDELVRAERVPIRAFEAGGVRETDTQEELQEVFLEKVKYFSGCTPIEAIAEKGPRSLAFGNFKPIGLTDPRTGRRPYAALQLRPENVEKSLYSLVACQNRLRFGEQKRVFQLIPGLESAEFVRYGVIHRNTYVDSPRVLNPNLSLKSQPNVFLAGQLTGVEGYVESAAMGILCGLIVHRKMDLKEFELPPSETALGALLKHLANNETKEFSPMNVNWGLLPEPEFVIKDKSLKRAWKLEQAHTSFKEWRERMIS